MHHPTFNTDVFQILQQLFFKKKIWEKYSGVELKGCYGTEYRINALHYRLLQVINNFETSAKLWLLHNLGIWLHHGRKKKISSFLFNSLSESKQLEIQLQSGFWTSLLVPCPAACEKPIS